MEDPELGVKVCEALFYSFYTSQQYTIINFPKLLQSVKAGTIDIVPTWADANYLDYNLN